MDSLPTHPDLVQPRHPDEPFTLAPITYVRVEGNTPGTCRWGIPEHERWRRENPQSSWARPEQRIPNDELDRSPFLCAGCEAPLAAWAKLRGFTHCSRECRESHRSR